MAVPPQLLMILVEAVSKLPNLIGATNALKDKIDAAIDFADKAQQTSLALGKTYEETRKTLGSQIEGLRGSLADRFRAGIETLNAGMTGNTMGISRLINQQMLTNTAFKNTADSFAKLEVALGLTRDETNTLALSLIKYNREYGISTDKLVEALNALRDTMPVQKLVGLGASFQDAIVQLQGIVGPQLSQQLTGFLKTVLDPSLENLSRLAGLGILEQRELLLANRNNSAALLEILQDMIKTAASRIRMFGQGAETEFSLASIPQMLFGERLLDSLALADGIGKRTKQIDEYIAEYYLTIQNLKRELFVPIENAFTTLHKPLMALYEVLAFVAKTIGTGVGKWLEETLSIGSDTLKQIKIGLLNFSKTVIEIFYPLVTYIGDNAGDLIRSVFTGIIDVFISFTQPGGALKSFEKGLYDLISGMMHLIDIFGAGMIFDDDTTIAFFEKKAALLDIEIAIADGARSISQLSSDQQKLIRDFNLQGQVANAFQVFASAADRTDALTRLGNALTSNGGEKPELIKTIERGIKLIEEGKPLDESMLAAMLRVAENTEKQETYFSDFQETSMRSLNTALQTIFGIQSFDSAGEIVDAINNLDGTIQRAQLRNMTGSSSFRAQAISGG